MKIKRFLMMGFLWLIPVLTFSQTDSLLKLPAKRDFMIEKNSYTIQGLVHAGLVSPSFTLRSSVSFAEHPKIGVIPHNTIPSNVSGKKSKKHK